MKKNWGKEYGGSFSLGSKSLGTDTETWSWFQLPIPKPGFGRTLHLTNKYAQELGHSRHLFLQLSKWLHFTKMHFVQFLSSLAFHKYFFTSCLINSNSLKHMVLWVPQYHNLFFIILKFKSLSCFQLLVG